MPIYDFEKQLDLVLKEYNGGFQKKINEIKETLSSADNVILWGYGEIGKSMHHFLTDNHINVKAICDSHLASGIGYDGVPLIYPDELKNYNKMRIVICSIAYYDEILAQILGMGIPFNAIVSLKKYFATISLKEFEKHIPGYEWAFNYFDDDLSKYIVISRIKSCLLAEPIEHAQNFFPSVSYRFSGNEIFVDAGTLHGDTINQFVLHTSGRYNHIYGFEPHPKHCARAQERFKSKNNIEILPYALSDANAELNFYFAELGSSAAHSHGANIVQTITIDSFFQDKEPPTFIKMNIEGGEQNALKGAEKILADVTPRLSLIAGHKISDIYLLPQTILKHNPSYKMCLCQRSEIFGGTMLHASVKESLI